MSSAQPPVDGAMHIGAGPFARHASRGARWMLLPIAIGVLVIVLAADFSTIPLIKTVAVTANILLAGRALLFWLVEAGAGEAGSDLDRADAVYMAIGLGACLVLLVLGFARLASLYSGAVVTGALAAFSLGTFLHPNFRARMRASALLSSGFLGYLAAAILLWLTFAPNNYFQLLASSVYLAQGFDLFSAKDPSVWPYFGELYHMPFMYVAHMVGATFGLFSDGDRTAYFEYGQYWLNIILAPIVPLGAYLFFRKFIPWWASVPLALFFIMRTVSFKVMSIRGETLGWIVGFGFLLGFCALLARLRTEAVERQLYGLMAATAALYFGVALTHGISATAVSLIALGLLVHHLAARPERGQFFTLLKLGGAGMLTLALLATIYWAGYLRGFPSPDDQAEPLRAGEPDAALQIEAHFSAPFHVDVRDVRSSPPYMSRPGVIAITALLPAAMLHDEEVGRIPVSGYPQVALDRVHAMSRAAVSFYVLAFILSCLVFMSALSGDPFDSASALFWAMVAGYLGLIAVAVAFNEVSVSLFPLAATRRMYIYGEFFYWSAVFLAIVRVFSAVARRLGSLLGFPRGIRWHRYHNVADGRSVPGVAIEFPPVAINLRALDQRMGSICQFLFVPLTIVVIVHFWAGPIGPGFRLTHALARTVAFREQFDTATGAPQGDRGDRADMYDAVRFIREHTRPDEWIFSNIISDNQFWYLSDGRYSLGEGSAMYQVYPLQRRAARRLAQFKSFALTADPEIIASYHPRYVLLFTQDYVCRLDGCTEFGFNLMKTDFRKFDASPAYSLVFFNAKYRIYRLQETGSQ